MKIIVSYTLIIIQNMLTYCRRKRLKLRLFTVVNRAEITVTVPGDSAKLMLTCNSEDRLANA
jgi:hypothetical protein